MAVLPLLGVISPSDVAAAYGSPLILLLMGGFLLSKGMESTGAHTRIAVTVVRFVGADEPKRLIMGFMLAAALLSMWISNTATVLMLLPVALAVIATSSAPKALAAPCCWGWHGLAVLVGWERRLEHRPRLSLCKFMRTRQAPRSVSVSGCHGGSGRRVDDSADRHSAGPESPDGSCCGSSRYWCLAQREKRVLIIFGLTALAWMTRTEPFGGWRAWFDMPMANDAAVAFCAVVALFITRDREGEPLISWEQASNIPWGVLLLFAGGITLAKGFVSSGLAVKWENFLPVLPWCQRSLR